MCAYVCMNERLKRLGNIKSSFLSVAKKGIRGGEKGVNSFIYFFYVTFLFFFSYEGERSEFVRGVQINLCILYKLNCAFCTSKK